MVKKIIKKTILILFLNFLKFIKMKLKRLPPFIVCMFLVFYPEYLVAKRVFYENFGFEICDRLFCAGCCFKGDKFINLNMNKINLWQFWMPYYCGNVYKRLGNEKLSIKYYKLFLKQQDNARSKVKQFYP